MRIYNLSYYTSYINKLKLACKDRKIDLIKVGQVDNLPIYKIILNAHAKKAVVFSAGIHGDEIAGPCAIIDFLKQSIKKRD